MQTADVKHQASYICMLKPFLTSIQLVLAVGPWMVGTQCVQVQSGGNFVRTCMGINEVITAVCELQVKFGQGLQYVVYVKEIPGQPASVQPSSGMV